jgi:hypothetical protein
MHLHRLDGGDEWLTNPTMGVTEVKGVGDRAHYSKSMKKYIK